MWTIYSQLITACLAIALAYLHKRLSERHAPIHRMARDKDTVDNRDMNVSA